MEHPEQAATAALESYLNRHELMSSARSDALRAVKEIVSAQRGRQTEIAAAVGVSGAYLSDVLNLNRAFGYELAESLLMHLRKSKRAALGKGARK